MSGLLPATAIVSPLPPAPTGVAEYSARIGSELAKHTPVALLTPAQAGRAREYERVIYQIGNNGLHAPVYRAALERRGVVELHDAVLHHMLLGALTRREYEDEFAYNEGESKRPLGAALWRERALSGADERFFHYPLLRRLVESATGVIVHNRAARRSAAALAGLPENLGGSPLCRCPGAESVRVRRGAAQALVHSRRQLCRRLFRTSAPDQAPGIGAGGMPPSRSGLPAADRWRLRRAGNTSAP